MADATPSTAEVDDIVERFKGKDMTVDAFVLGHFYQP